MLIAACCGVTVAAAATPAHDDIRWLQRATFGLDAASLASYRQLGRQA